VRHVRTTGILNHIDYYQTFSGVEMDRKKFNRWWREWQEAHGWRAVNASVMRGIACNQLERWAGIIESRPRLSQPNLPTLPPPVPAHEPWQDTLSLATVLSARVQDPAIKEAVGEIRKTTLGLVTPLRRKGSDLDQSREDAKQLREDLMDNWPGDSTSALCENRTI
jgi:hypothetical protein